MPIVWWGLVGLGAAALVNTAADCWLSPARPSTPGHPARQLIVWLGLPALFMGLAWQIAAPDALWQVCLGSTVLALLAVVDLEQRRVPNVVVLPATALALLVALAEGQGLSALAGAVVAGGGFLALAAMGRRLYGPAALGMGDVKLAAAWAVSLGWLVVPAFAVACLLGAVWALAARQRTFALGPWLSAAFAGALLLACLVS